MNRCLELKGYGELGVENHPLLHTVLEGRTVLKILVYIHPPTSVPTLLIFLK
jgi:hypothetical protein